MEQNVFIWRDSAFVTYKFLLEKGVPKSTIYNSTSSKNKLRWSIRRHPENIKLRLIAYESIPLSIIQKYKLPQFSELKIIAELESKKRGEENSGKVSKILQTILDFEYNNWKTIKNVYEYEVFDDQKIESFCKTHLLLYKCMELKAIGYKLKDLYKIFIKYDGLAFETLNYKTFCNKISRIEKSNGIEDDLLNKLKKHKSNNQKITEDAIVEIKKFFLDPTNYNFKEILTHVNSYLVVLHRRPISCATLQKVISQNIIKNESMIYRFSDKYAENHLLPHLHFVPPQNENMLWLMDSSQFQFAYKTEKEMYSSLTLFIVLDGSSKKVVGYSFDERENSKMAISAFENACRNTGCLPREIISDNSLAIKTDEYQRIVSCTKELGVSWRIVHNNPRENAYVERFFGLFHESICKKYDGYLCVGIKSKYLNARPSSEEIRRFLSTKRLRTKSELIELLDKLIKEYNDLKERVEPLRNINHSGKLQQTNNTDPIPLNDELFSKLFREQK